VIWASCRGTTTAEKCKEEVEERTEELEERIDAHVMRSLSGWIAPPGRAPSRDRQLGPV